MTLRVLIAVTHLLGAGHLTRAAALARAFAREGHETILVSGGTPARLADLGEVRLVQLPPVRTVGTDFKTLLDENLRPVDDAYLAARQALLLDTLRDARPDILITELFPFGRRVLASEFTALLEAARALNPRPLVLCSIRDILVAPSKPERLAQAHERLLRNYDAILVHGDPDLVPLEASWPVDDTDQASHPLYRLCGRERGLGSCRFAGMASWSRAVRAPRACRSTVPPSKRARLITDRPWRILVGRSVPEADFQALQEGAPPHVGIERARPDFRALLSGAEISVSQAGYNTVVDLLRCGVRSVLVPFEAGQETEQRLRAERLKSLNLAGIVPEDELSGRALRTRSAMGCRSPRPRRRTSPSTARGEALPSLRA